MLGQVHAPPAYGTVVALALGGAGARVAVHHAGGAEAEDAAEVVRCLAASPLPGPAGSGLVASGGRRIDSARQQPKLVSAHSIRRLPISMNLTRGAPEGGEWLLARRGRLSAPESTHQR